MILSYRNLKKVSNVKTVFVEHAEADDIVAEFKKLIRRENPIRDIYILASDMDYLQILDEHTFLITCANKLLNHKSIGDPAIDLSIKIIRGDNSDNIPGCFKTVWTENSSKICNTSRRIG